MKLEVRKDANEILIRCHVIGQGFPRTARAHLAESGAILAGEGVREAPVPTNRALPPGQVNPLAIDPTLPRGAGRNPWLAYASRPAACNGPITYRSTVHATDARPVRAVPFCLSPLQRGRCPRVLRVLLEVLGAATPTELCQPP